MMEVVALVSGGKDSCYSILKAQALGYKVVALAHIIPPCEEADSMMYQSVGSMAVPLISESMGLPLIVRQTKANAKSTSLNYHSTAGDEVEDLIELLNDVKTSVQSVKAVCSGALWSDYQRLRVEYAASRCELLSLAPLWHRNQAELLDEMISCGIDAILIKVAGVGLNQTHLGRSLSEMRPLLHKLDKKYGSHICGEGGEYESFVQWMPGFQKRIDFKKTEVVLHSNDIIAPVSFLRLQEPFLSSININSHKNLCAVPVHNAPPFRFEPREYAIQMDTAVVDSHMRSVSGANPISSGESSNFLYLTVFSTKQGKGGVQDVCHLMRKHVEDKGLFLQNVVSVQLYLRMVSGKEYKEANISYNETFQGNGITIPPVRACIGVQTGNDGTTMEVMLRNGTRSETVSLHVQSLSEWAPPCIGPYSQFVEEDGLFHVSGVLPLHPASASVLNGMPVKEQIEACFENISRTLEAGRGEINNIRVFIFYVTTPLMVQELKGTLRNIISENQSIQVVLPASALPRGAMVEVKSVGILEACGTPIEKNIVAEHKVSFETILCGVFTFAVFKSKSVSVDIDETVRRIVKHVSTTESKEGVFQSVRALALQLYCRSDVPAAKVEEETSQLKNISVSRFTSGWLPEDMKWLGVLLICREN